MFSHQPHWLKASVLLILFQINDITRGSHGYQQRLSWKGFGLRWFQDPLSFWKRPSLHWMPLLVNGDSVAEKSWLKRARRLLASSLCRLFLFVLCAQWNWWFQVTSSFFVDAVLLCFACVEKLCALELLHPSNVFYSSVLQSYGVLQLSVCRPPWNGCVNAGRKVAALQYCLAILIVFCKSFLADRIGTAASWMRFVC